ncbi:TPA: hypothetical protein DEG75_04300 [Candidatus Dependentiae bacterium]|nr:hypothetical protein [Candidatus Dependentiae bacterium]
MQSSFTFFYRCRRESGKKPGKIRKSYMCDLYLLMQIFLESLPISSSGHLDLLGLSVPWAVDFFAHGPTVLMLIVYFAPTLREFLFSSACKMSTCWYLLVMLFCAECFTPLFYILFSIILPRPPLWFGFLCTMLLLFSLRFCRASCSDRVGFKEAGAVGLMQGIALLPGVSRLASTYAVGRWMGLSATTAFRLSCALQIPLFAGGAVLGSYALWRKNELASFLTPTCLVSLLLASVGAFFLLKIVEKSMEREWLWLLGFYMIIPFVAALLVH